MPARGEIYKCRDESMMVEVVIDGQGEFLLHGKPMEKLTENTQDAAREKHVPEIEKIAGGYRVTVGSVEHPMEESHFIQWIELLAGDLVMRRYLSPGGRPVAEFLTSASDVSAREFCNLHGLWKADA
ncbi:MAG: desulfoferrodoxin [Candidatus Glassbacteria bacterium]|nr:desulfoferrodoxin [Candidatus Glassbacteria bacterium]